MVNSDYSVMCYSYLCHWVFSLETASLPMFISNVLFYKMHRQQIILQHGIMKIKQDLMYLVFKGPKNKSILTMRTLTEVVDPIYMYRL